MTLDSHNPYVGLRPFERKDNLYFFGRREQTGELLERLHETRFLGVIGSSGGGKSSLVRAGVVPALLGGFLVESRDRWQIATLKPGNAPIRNLAAALCQEMEQSPDQTNIIELQNAITENHLAAVREYLADHLAADTNLLVLIDQFEEIFSFRGIEFDENISKLSREQRQTRAHRRAESADFVDLMLGLSSQLDLPVYTILTMRTDFLGDCDVFYGLPEAMNRSQYLVPRLNRSQLRDAIVGPALLSRAEIAPRLLDEVLNAVGDRADQLPVLQHAMLRTWDVWQEQQDDVAIDLQHYQQAGTFTSSLKQDANRALARVDSALTERIFKCLTDTDLSHRRVRRPSQLSELAAVSGAGPDKVREILEVFREDHRNFVILSSEDIVDDPRVDISHESLIRQWDSLRDWVDEERESRDKFLELVERGRSFSDGRKTAPLQDPDLQVALDWRARFSPTEPWARRYSKQPDDYSVAMDYLDQSHSEAEAKKFSAQLRTWGLRTGYALVAIVVLTLSIGYLTVRDELRGIEADYSHLDFKPNNKKTAEQLLLLSELSQLILAFGRAEQNWKLPWGELFSSLPQRREYIDRYIRIIQEQVLKPMDGRVSKVAGSDLNGQESAFLIIGILRRIQLISASDLSDQESFDAVPFIPEQYLRVIDREIEGQSSLLFNELYRNYLRLNDSYLELEDERLRLQSILASIISAGRGNFDWLVNYTALQGFADVKPGDFWRGSRQLVDGPRVASVYTLDGFNFINDTLDDLEIAISDSLSFGNFRSSFTAQYERDYLETWQRFAEEFDYGMNMLRNRKEWLQAVKSMTLPSNPYFSFMRRIEREVKPVFAEAVFTATDLIAFFARVQDFGNDDFGLSDSSASKTTALKIIGKLGKAGKLIAKVGKKGLKARKKLVGQRREPLDIDLEDASRAYAAYTESLKNIAFDTGSNKLAYSETAFAFSNPGDLSSGDGAGAQAWEAIINMQRVIGRPTPRTKIFWDLYSGPVRLAYRFMQEEAACYLQASWEDNVLEPISGVSDNKVGENLIGDGGLLWKYIDNEAGPFLGRKFKEGYVANRVNGNALDWTPEFIEFANNADKGRAIVSDEFRVDIRAVPTGVNQYARISPYATYLELHCADGVQTLANYNYATGKTFHWALSSCGDVTLNIQLGNVTLRKNYEGKKGFPKFLSDFRDGHRVFTSAEFPEYESQLLNEDVSAFDVNYKIRGQQPVIAMISAVPLNPPHEAIACWAQ